MPRRHVLRSIGTLLVVATVVTACSAPGDRPTVTPPSAVPTEAPRPTLSLPPTPSRPASPDPGPLELTAARVSIRPPHRGSFRVQGAYPWRPSRCVRPERPILDGRYPGTLAIRTADDGTLTVAVTLPFDAYLEGIAEVPPTWPAAALEAQAIAARSYVLSTTGWAGQEGAPLATPICGTSACQVYGGIPMPRPPGLRRWYAAVRDTEGQVLMYGDRPADTVYFSTSNGRTYGNEDVFGSSPLPYLRPVVEHDDGASPLAHWRVELPLRDLATVLQAAGSWPAGTPIGSASVGGSGVTLVGGGRSRTIDTSSMRDAVNAWAPCLLPRRYPTDGLPVTIPSGWFTMSAHQHGLVVEGRGWGHGVGMVQWGAYGKAARGWSASKILAFYYGGLTPRPYPEPSTITVIVASGLRSLTVDPSRVGATVGGQPLPKGTLRVSGGNEVTVTTSG
jgi:stage II sporulation protein D